MDTNKYKMNQKQQQQQMKMWRPFPFIHLYFTAGFSILRAKWDPGVGGMMRVGGRHDTEVPALRDLQFA